MYKQAIRMGLRFLTPRGMLTIEQLWQLSLQELDNLAVALEEEYNKSKGKSFLDKKTTKDAIVKLKFDIALDVLNTKAEEDETARVSSENKQHNKKILELIASKQDEELKGKSVAQLEKMMKPE